MKEIIERLKDKNYVRAFGLMSKKEQEAYRKVGRNNCNYFDDDCSWSNGLAYSKKTFFNQMTYAIKPDYQPEPGYVDLEIEEDDERLGIWDKGNFIPIHCLPSRTNFFCFWQVKNNKGYKDTEHISLEVVATSINGGMKVYARLRK